MKPKQHRAPGCPRCWEPLPRDLLALGHAYCGSCALEFRSAVFDAQAQPAPAVPDAAAISAARCARHARNAAVGACERCGSFMCGLCRVEADGKAFCAACFDRLGKEGLIESATTEFKSWHSLSLYLALGGIFLWPLGVLVGPAALVAAFNGRRQARALGEKGGLFGFALVLFVGLCEFAGGLAFVFSMTTTLRKFH